MFAMFSWIFTLSVILAAAVESTKSPHVILIVGDDLGFNDFSYRGSEDIHTPNIDALGYAGRILDRHYTLPTCTPSRSSLLTGLHAVRTGMQGYPLKVGEPRGLPLNFKILPQYLKELNYSTHLIGKWHIGSHRWAYTPTYRGYDSFFGYYNGFIGYFSHEVAFRCQPSDLGPPPRGYDFHRNDTVAFDLRGRYATDLFTTEAEKLIREHDPEKPLFLQVSLISAHTGENQTSNEVADETANNRRFGFIQDGHRRRYAGSVTALDDSVGTIVRALADRDMLSDSLIVFLNDNGGMTTGPHNNSGSNWPLRGQKHTLFDGGVRTAAVVWHKNMQPTSKPHMDLFHITDWLPTLYEAAGGKVASLGKIDGVSHWKSLSRKESLSVTSAVPRKEFLVNSQEAGNRAFIKGWLKYVEGAISFPQYYTRYSGDPGRTPGRKAYNLSDVVHSDTTKRLFQASGQEGYDSLEERAAEIRRLSTLPSICRDNATEDLDCTAGCLFNLRDDPCETTNIANRHPEIVFSINLKLVSWDLQTVRQLNTEFDFVNSDPRKFGGAWVPWLDVQPSNTTHSVISSNSGSRNFGNFVRVMGFTVLLLVLTDIGFKAFCI